MNTPSTDAAVNPRADALWESYLEDRDREWRAFNHVLERSVLRYLRGQILPFLDAEEQEIDWQGLINVSGAWSTGERLLLQGALALLEPYEGPIPNEAEMRRTLSDDQVRIWLEAIAIRFPDNVKAEG